MWNPFPIHWEWHARPWRDATVVDVTAQFVTAIRVPEAVTSVAVGDPALFKAEHSDHGPDLAFVKVLTANPAELDLLISTAEGHEFACCW